MTMDSLNQLIEVSKRLGQTCQMHAYKQLK